ncbi:cation diffusion facilitator family transporter, partial [Kaarinaea lacus]
MSKSHNHSHAGNEKRLSWAIGLTGIFMVVEVGGGIISGSLALLADAAHMLTDMSSLLLAWIAARIAKKPADKLRSYGYHRVQILAAFINGASFFVIVIWIGYEATQRLLQPRDVMGGVMLIIAFTGLLVNVIVFYILHGGDQKDLNLRGALVHVIGDMLGSFAAIVSAGVIMLTGWTPIDPLLSILVAILILRSAWFVVRHSTHILLEGTPEDVDVRQIRETLSQVIP